MTGKPTRPTLRPRYANTQAVVIVERAGDQYVARVDPLMPGFEQPAVFDHYRTARGFAGGIRLTRGYAIDDRCGE